MACTQSCARAAVVVALWTVGLLTACGPVTIIAAAKSNGNSSTPDTQAPETFLVTGPPAFVNQLGATFEFAANEAVSRFDVRWYIDGTKPPSWTGVNSPYTFQVETEGAYTLDVRAVDTSSNMDPTPSSYSWTVDLTPPTAPVTLEVIPTQTTAFQLSWTPASDGLSGLDHYRVYYTSDPVTPPAHEGDSGFSTGLATSTQLNGLVSCQIYSVCVTATDRAGNESTRVTRELRAWCGWDETFTPLLYPVGLDPEDLVAADLDGDGIMDVAVLDRGSQDISVLLGSRGGEARIAAQSPLPAGANPIALVAADFDGDGPIDLLTLNMISTSAHRLTWLRGGCGGTFEPATDIGSVASNQATCLATADWSGSTGGTLFADGYPDILAGNTYVRGCPTGGCNVCHHGAGAGVLENVCGFDLSGSPIACATGDFNGDGRPDAAVLTADGVVHVHRFGAQSSVDEQCAGYCYGALTSVFAGDGASCLVVADLNSDGTLDLAVGNDLSDSVAILYGIGNASFTLPTHYFVGAPSHALVVADLDADGIDDLAAATTK